MKAVTAIFQCRRVGDGSVITFLKTECVGVPVANNHIAHGGAITHDEVNPTQEKLVKGGLDWRIPAFDHQIFHPNVGDSYIAQHIAERQNAAVAVRDRRARRSVQRKIILQRNRFGGAINRRDDVHFNAPIANSKVAILNHHAFTNVEHAGISNFDCFGIFDCIRSELGVQTIRHLRNIGFERVIHAAIERNRAVDGAYTSDGVCAWCCVFQQHRTPNIYHLVSIKRRGVANFDRI